MKSRPADWILKIAFFLALLAFWPFISQTSPTVVRIAVLDLGDSPTSRHVTDKVTEALTGSLATDGGFRFIDRDQTRVAAAGNGYKGSLNMTLSEARDLGAAIGCEFFVTGAAETLRRSPSDGPAYFDSYAAIYVVSSRTGRLAFWERFSAKASTSDEAERHLVERVIAPETRSNYRRQINRALEDELASRTRAIESPAPVIDEAVDEAATTDGLRLPRPYRRLKPPYPEPAANAEIEATVDALVDIDARGEVGNVEIARWAGYGLDQSVVETVKQLHFFPAQRDGENIPIRVLLRYNFRKPPRDSKSSSNPKP